MLQEPCLFLDILNRKNQNVEKIPVKNMPGYICQVAFKICPNFAYDLKNVFRPQLCRLYISHVHVLGVIYFLYV